MRTRTPFLAATTLAAAFAPDIVYNHGGEGGRPSDQVKETLYHEYAHASHFNALNNGTYWLANITYILAIAANPTMDGYGDGTLPGAGRCAVIEMWGFHYGPVCADTQYGVLHSNTASTDPFIIERTRHIFLLEAFVPILPPTNTAAWIPRGVFLDLIDDNAANPPGVVDGAGFEAVTGYTHANCFSAISGSPADPTVVRNILTGSSLPPGQTVAAVNALFSIYGF